ncbi:MAG: NUDIX domain-containing protein [Elusimicrobia bacterium]|nr:NUDIX domain-containing protein [Elusimicrobiota bacterium]
MKTEFEFSGGGIVKKDGKVLLILTDNLAGRRIWTFPKGKVEKGETVAEAALREVLEETGYGCRIEGKLKDIGYIFERRGRLVIKKVTWYGMSVVSKEGEHDKDVHETAWKTRNEAAGLLNYSSDLELLEMVYKNRV